MNDTNKKQAHFFTSLDIIVTGLVLFVSFLILGLSLINKSNSHVEIQTDQGTYIYPLGEDRDLVLDGPLGKTYVSISDKRVDVTKSPGRKQICVNATPISKGGEWLVCLPNKIFIKITGKGASQQEIDALVF